MTVLLTGFPGFIASRLLEHLLAGEDPPRFYVLVEPRFIFVAKAACESLERRFPKWKGRWHIVEGDVTRPGLGMSQEALDYVRASVTHVWHLAASHDLAAPLAQAYRINVDGTLHVLDLCAELGALERLFYVSTCYVAGDRTGVVYEDELDMGQGFKNHYESTKMWAEKHVRQRSRVLPTTVFRPAVVVGNSQTGETQNGDGPHTVIRLLLRLPRLLPLVHLGPLDAELNLVPVDWVVESMVALSRDERSRGLTFHLADPCPWTARQILDALLAELDRGRSLGAWPLGWVQPLLERPTGQRLTGISPRTLDYLHHPVSFATDNVARLLADSGRPCPRFDSYVSTIVGYAREHPQIFRRSVA